MQLSQINTQKATMNNQQKVNFKGVKTMVGEVSKITFETDVSKITDEVFDRGVLERLQEVFFHRVTHFIGSLNGGATVSRAITPDGVTEVVLISKPGGRANINVIERGKERNLLPEDIEDVRIGSRNHSPIAEEPIFAETVSHLRSAFAVKAYEASGGGKPAVYESKMTFLT